MNDDTRSGRLLGVLFRFVLFLAFLRLAPPGLLRFLFFSGAAVSDRAGSQALLRRVEGFAGPARPSDGSAP